MNDISINNELREDAVQQVMKEGRAFSVRDFIDRVSAKFIENQLHAFPRYCEIARWQNKLKWDELKEIGNKGKYTDSIGWSAQRDFKFEYEIPSDLYLFMTNLVYKDFWSDENSRVWRSFMSKVCMGDDSMELLMGVKKLYGNNMQEGIVVNQ